MIIKLITIGIIIFLGFRLINLIVGKTSLPKRILHHLDYILPLLELIVWFAYISWAVLIAYQARKYFVLFFLALSFLLLIVPAFLLIRDLIFGIFFKALNKIIEGKVIEIDGVKGTIVQAGLFFLNMEDSSGIIKSIGYYQIKSKVISILGENHELEKLDLEFDLPLQGNINEMVKRLESQLLSTPWVAVSNPPIIEKVNRRTEKLSAKVGIYTLNKKYGENIKSMVNLNWE